MDKLHADLILEVGNVSNITFGPSHPLKEWGDPTEKSNSNRND